MDEIRLKKGTADWDPKSWRVGNPETTALRAYRAYHPGIRVYHMVRNGRQVWLTWKQYTILRYIDEPRHRNRRLTLAAIAKACRCSPATVSRTLVRFDLWRFVDYIGLVGRNGGAWIRTRVGKYNEQDANAARARHTIESRKVARSWLATQLRLQAFRERWERKERPKPPHRWVVTSGSMDGMFT